MGRAMKKHNRTHFGGWVASGPSSLAILPSTYRWLLVGQPHWGGEVAIIQQQHGIAPCSSNPPMALCTPCTEIMQESAQVGARGQIRKRFGTQSQLILRRTMAVVPLVLVHAVDV
mmetsp:Transcript_101796/g.172453  ORF Transcript_101796/g.172453 Transcript_101796/m.172453 type:complete len:115 (+) Transcript_101796:1640-1984(+)